MSLDSDVVLRAILQLNYLPTQSVAKDELPPVFSTESFSEEVANAVTAGQQRANSTYRGYDAVEYRLTRFNGVSRTCSIPHPYAYAHLALCIYRNWTQFSYIEENENSLSKPWEREDGRFAVMSYLDSAADARSRIGKSFGCRFVVYTDIANFYPSIYSHAISWALVGFKVAKQNRGPANNRIWYNELDEKVRSLKRGETQGIAIGPGTSSILSEAVLARVDAQLRDRFAYNRFIDDYTAYCKTEDDAQDFIRVLAEELAKFKLHLNIQKTKILSLPQPLETEWVSELSLLLPKSSELSVRDVIMFMSHAVRLARQSPSGSVLKYALRALAGGNLEAAAAELLREYILNLSFSQPVLLPLLDRLFRMQSPQARLQNKESLSSLALEHIRLAHSDAMSWILYFHDECGIDIEEDVALEIIKSRDCVSLVLLYHYGSQSHKDRVLEFVASLDHSDLYELDQYWLLLYELFRVKAIPSPYKGENAFEIMLKNKVRFLESSQRS